MGWWLFSLNQALFLCSCWSQKSNPNMNGDKACVLLGYKRYISDGEIGLTSWFHSSRSNAVTLKYRSDPYVRVTPTLILFCCHFIALSLLLLWIIMFSFMFSDALRRPLWRDYLPKGCPPHVENCYLDCTPVPQPAYLQEKVTWPLK